MFFARKLLSRTMCNGMLCEKGTCLSLEKTYDADMPCRRAAFAKPRKSCTPKETGVASLPASLCSSSIPGYGASAKLLLIHQINDSKPLSSTNMLCEQADMSCKLAAYALLSVVQRIDSIQEKLDAREEMSC